MIDGCFVIDAVVHAFDLSEENFASAPTAEAIAQGQVTIVEQGPPGYVLPAEAVRRDWAAQELAGLLFDESATDVAVYHPTPIYAFKDGLSGIDKGLEARERWPERFIGLYATVDPVAGDAAVKELDRQCDLFKPLGLKLYPTTWRDGVAAGWRMDDPKIAFPLFEAAAERGIKTIAVHKALPLGPIDTGGTFAVDDIEGAATAFPDLNFEIVHGGSAFTEETAWLLGRFSNVWVNMEFLGMVLCYRPRLFERIMLGLMHVGGEAVLDRMLWASGAMQFHPQLQLRSFMDFQFADEQREGAGLFGPEIPPLSDEHRQKVLGLNYATLHGLDIDGLKAGLDDSELSFDPADPPAPWSSTAVGVEAI
jgi:uncharacterized protein